MREPLRALLEQLHRDGAQHDRAHSDRLQRLRNLEPDSAALLSLGAWELIFLDAERSSYAAYWPDLLAALAPGGLFAVDNVLSHAEEVAHFRALVSAEGRVREALAPTGAGLLLIVRERDPEIASGDRGNPSHRAAF